MEQQAPGVTCLFTKNDWDVYYKIQDSVERRCKYYTYTHLIDPARKPCIYPECPRTAISEKWTSKPYQLCVNHIGWWGGERNKKFNRKTCQNCKRRVLRV